MMFVSLNSKMETATSGVGTVTSGVGTATSGVGTVTSGVGTVTSGVGTVTSGVGTVTSGVGTATSGVGTADPSRAPEFIHVFLCDSCCSVFSSSFIEINLSKYSLLTQKSFKKLYIPGPNPFDV
jgi:X-X-X-Leu-X-X-Gly heptad repeat protein